MLQRHTHTQKNTQNRGVKVIIAPLMREVMTAFLTQTETRSLTRTHTPEDNGSRPERRRGGERWRDAKKKRGGNFKGSSRLSGL